MDDPVNHPSHYTQYEHEVIELTEKLDFCLGNAAKYILRAEYKGNEEEDLNKAIWYLDRYVKLHESVEALIFLPDEVYDLAETFDKPLLGVLFRRGIDERVAAKQTIDAINQYLRDVEYLDIEKENQRLKEELEKMKEKSARSEAEIARLQVKLHDMDKNSVYLRRPGRDMFGAWIVY